MSDKGGLQLLPENRRKIDVKVPGQNRLIGIGMGFLIVVILIYGGLILYGKSIDKKIESADKQLAEIATQASAKKDSMEALNIISKQMAITEQIINNHTFWSIAFSKIEDRLAGAVQFKSLSAQAADATLNIRASTDTYATIARQLAAFTGTDGVTDVSLDGVNTLTTGKLDFNTKLTFNKEKFLKQNKKK